MKKLVIGMLLSAPFIAFANTTIVSSSSDIKAISVKGTIPANDIKPAIIKAQEALKNKDNKTYWVYVNKAAKYGSGWGYLQLGKQKLKALEKKSTDDPSDSYNMMNDFYLAVEHGYPEAYELIGYAYLRGIGVKKDNLIGACYANLGKEKQDLGFTEFCENKLGANFKVLVNKGFSNRYETKMAATTALKQFCNTDSNILNPKYSFSESEMLKEMICKQKNGVYSRLKNKDLVLMGDGIKEFQDGRFLKYLAPLTKGQVVYKVNQPYTPYVYDGKGLKVAKNGAVILKNHTRMIIDNTGHLKIK